MGAIMKVLLVSLILFFAAAAWLPQGICAEDTKRSAADRGKKDTPQLLEFTFSNKYPFREETNPFISSVSFLYAYEKPDEEHDAFKDALESLESYIFDLSNAQNPADSANVSMKRTVQIVETNGGNVNSPKIYSVRQAVHQSTKSKEFEIEIKYWREEPITRPDGTKEIKRDLVKTERQDFTLTDDPRGAKVEVRCLSCDAVKLADKLFSSPH